MNYSCYLLFVTLIVFPIHAQAQNGGTVGTVGTCELQHDCFAWQVKKLDTPACTFGDEDCIVEVCMKINTSSPNCAKKGGTISHVCDASDSQGCPHGSLDQPIFDMHDFKSDCSAVIGQGGADTTSKCTGVSEIMMCQEGIPGSTLHFIMKDGNDVTAETNDPDDYQVKHYGSGKGCDAAYSCQNDEYTCGDVNAQLMMERVWSYTIPKKENCDLGCGSTTQLSSAAALLQEAPLRLPKEIAFVYVACSDPDQHCGEKDIDVASLTDEHEVRCCSDIDQDSWTQNTEYGCNVWGRADLETTAGDGNPICHPKASYKEAVDICKANGARICSKEEIQGRCTANSGCDEKDLGLTWTSTLAAPPPRVVTAPPSEAPLPDDTYKYLACGDPKLFCENKDVNVAQVIEKHEVRCCADEWRTGWSRFGRCSVWAASELWDADGTSFQCHHEATFEEADAICKANGARLCTKEEVLARCTRGSGCGHDLDLLWTSTPASDKAIVAYKKEVKIASDIKAVCQGPTASIWGDPHMKTFDGLKYDCQGKGEFVLAMSKDDDPLQIHGRFVAASERRKFFGPSTTRSLAVKIDENVPVVHITIPDSPDASGGCPFSYSIGSNETEIPEDQLVSYFSKKFSGLANAYTNGKNVIFTYPEKNARIEIGAQSTKAFGCMMRTNICLTPEKHGGGDNIIGLLGSPNDNVQDDWMKSDMESETFTIPEAFSVSEPTKEDKKEIRRTGHKYCMKNWCVSKVKGSLYSDETYEKFNQCPNQSYDPDAFIEIIKNLDPLVVAKCQESTENPDECVMDIAIAANETDQNPMDLVEELVQNEREMIKVHNLNEEEIDGQFEDWVGPDIVTTTNQVTAPNPPAETTEPETQTTEAEVTLKTPTTSGSNGDPHFKTWKQEHFEYHGQCDMILTKDEGFANGIGLDVQIRTKLVRYWSYIQNVAIRIGDDILEVEGSAEPFPFPSKEISYWINLEYQGELKTLGGFPVKGWRKDAVRTRFIIDLSSKFPGQQIEIATYQEFIRIDFQNGTEESYGNTIGLLGDFKTGKTLARDGVTNLDDFYEFGNEWQVLPSDFMLFHDIQQPQFPQRCIIPEDPHGERHRRLDEESITEADAEKACSHLTDAADRKDCVYDILATQDLGMVGAY